MAVKIDVGVSGNRRWLNSAHGIWQCRTEVINVSAFTAGTHYPNGFIPSGTAVALVTGKLVPFNSAGTGGTEVLAGFIFDDIPIPAGATATNAPLLDHGRIATNNLPLAWTAPLAGKDATQCVYVTRT